MGLYDNNLNVVVNYAYDSWGNTVSITGSLADTLGQDNPFRYRGYYYDNDTGLYYLNSRYYDSNTGRFINADGLVQTGQGLLDKNMFAYCMNNPINYVDFGGTFPIGLLVGIGVSLLTGWLVAEGSNKTNKTTKINVQDVLEAAAGEVSDTAKVVIGSSTIKNGYDNAIEQRRQHSKNMVEASYAKSKNQSFSAKSISDTIFSSDEQYTKYCLSKVDSFNQFMEGSAINIRGKHWNDLSEEDQLIIESNTILWDPDILKSIGMNNGVEAGFGIAN